MNNETENTTSEMKHDSANMGHSSLPPSTTSGTVTGLAPLGPRIAAAVIDSFVPMVIYIPMVIIMMILAYIKLGILNSIVGLLTMAIIFGYVFLKDCLPFLGGQSIGKKLMKLRVVTEDGKPITGNWQAGIMRNVMMFVSPVELIVLIVREGKPEAGRRIGDDMAKTKVVMA